MKVMRKVIDAGKNEVFYDSSHDEESDYNEVVTDIDDEINEVVTDNVDDEINEVVTDNVDESKIIRVDFQLLMLELIYYNNINPIDYISRFNINDEIDLSQPCFVINSKGDIKPLHPEYIDSVTVHKNDGIVYDFVYDFKYGKINFSISFKSLMTILNFNK